MKVLVTGGSGMVGRNILADPRASQYEVMSPDSALLDLRDEAATRAWFKANRPDAVIHSAGIVGGIQANINQPVRFAVDNVRIGLNLLMAARDAQVRAILNLGSSCMYPRDRDTPLAPADLLAGELEPTNEGYALAKILAWKIASYMRRENPDLIYKTLVPCNLFGLHDHFDPVRSHLVPAAIMKLCAATRDHANEVEIWGDGSAKREFMFATDFADFVWTFLPRLEELPDVMNVGVGQDHAIRDYYEITARIVGYSGGFKYDTSKPAGMKRKLLDVSAQRELGWEPRHTLAQGIAKTVEFYRTFA